MKNRLTETGTPTTRRGFVRAVTGMGLLAPLAVRVSSAASITGTNPIGAPRSGASPAGAEGAVMDRPICIFSKHLQFLEYAEMADATAEIGADGVDLSVRPGGHVVPERVEEDLPSAVEQVRGAGLDVYTITTAITDPDDPLTEPILRTASALGIPYYRLGYLDYDPERSPVEVLDALRPRMRDLGAMNASYGMHGGYQNHSGTRIGGPVWDVARLLEGLDPEGIGCQYDIRHATVEGGTAWPVGLRLLRPYIRTTVVKDFHWEQRDGRWRIKDVPIGEGMVDFPLYYEMVRDLGISGPVSMHFEYEMPEGGAEQRRDTVAIMKKDLGDLRGFMRDAGL